MTGKFITFEGPEGSGKTTQAKRLLEHLHSTGTDAFYTREPGGTPTGEAIRDILQHNAAGEHIADECEVLLFAASRAQLVRRIILPALERGLWVISDRFADSTTVYQGYGRGFPVDDMLTINAFAIGPAIPDITFLLDIPLEMGFQRLHERLRNTDTRKDRIESEARDFHERVHAGYRELARRFPERFRIIDATGCIDDVARTIQEHIGDVTT